MEQGIIWAIKKAVKEIYNIEISEVLLKDVPKKQFGDLSFNCGVLARETKKNPAIIATELLALLQKEDFIEDVQSAWPFINFKISESIYSDNFKEIYSKKSDFLSPVIGNNETIIVDYIWTNVWKPMHIGHICPPTQWQVFVNLYKKLWYNVISDSHIWDWWIIFGKLITAYKLWWDDNKLKENAVEHLFQLYVKVSDESENNNQLDQDFRTAFKNLSEGDLDSIKLWESFTKESIKSMQIQLDRLNVKSDYNIWESFYEGLWLPKIEDYPDLKWDMKDIVKELIEKKIATKNEDNSVWVVFDDSTKLSSCILQKRDWTHGYLASDLACIKYRTDNWSPKKIIYFVDWRQQLHFKQAFTISKKAWWIPETELFHAYNWFISLKDWAMSTRKWRIIKLDKLLDEAELRAKKIILEKNDTIKWKELDKISKIIWIWAIKYGYLKKSRETDVIFDWDEFMTFEWNSGPYIQYAYVRARRILEKFWKDFSKLDISAKFEHKEEIELFKQVQNYTDILKKTADTNMPHHLCTYAFNLTKKFSTFYNSIHILNEEDEDKKILRLQLIDMFSSVLKDSFNILGIDMPEKM